MKTDLRHAGNDDAKNERNGPGGEMKVGRLPSQVFPQLGRISSALLIVQIPTEGQDDEPNQAGQE